MADAGDRHQNEATGLRQELGNLKDKSNTVYFMKTEPNLGTMDLVTIMINKER